MLHYVNPLPAVVDLVEAPPRHVVSQIFKYHLFRIPGELGINRHLYSSFSTYPRPCTLARLTEVRGEGLYICGMTVFDPTSVSVIEWLLSVDFWEYLDRSS